MTTQDPEDAAVAASGFDEPIEFDGDAVLYEEQVQPQHGLLGLTIRELSITGVWLVAFIVSFFPVLPGGASLWGSNIDWLLPIGVPTAAVFLIVLRRFSPDGIRRVGSLGIDQFASVAFSVAAVWWLQQHWSLVSRAVAVGTLPFSWVNWVQLAAMLALVVLTVFAPFVPGLRDDFHGRMETLAHRNADPVRPVVARPASTAPASTNPASIDTVPTDADAWIPDAEEPDAAADASPDVDGAADMTDVADSGDQADEADLPIASLLGFEPVESAEPDGPVRVHATDEVPRFEQPERVPLSAHASGGDTGTALFGDATDDVDDDSIDDEDPPARRLRRTGSVPVVDAAAAPAAAQPFWALAPTERDVVDEQGAPLFRIGPTAWALVLEDRGGAYVIRHDDGRIGYLHDIADITKG